MHWLIYLAMILFSWNAMAFCPFSPNLINSLGEEVVVTMYESCATSMNDDTAQIKLAQIYDKGTPAIPKDRQKAIYYYQLSADNGNAESQTRLAQIFQEMDKSRENRRELKKYMNSITKNDYVLDSSRYEKDGFKGQLMHPYVLLLLATEKPENKWYYPTTVVKAPAYAATLLKSYNKYDEAKKAELSRQASAWKKRKLLEIARQVLSAKEYATFENTLYPKVGQGDSFKRSQTLSEFKKKVEEYKKQDEESAAAFY